MLHQNLYELSVIVEAGSFSAAAERLGLSQSALTRHVAALEEELGTKVIERSQGGVRLTQAGRFACEAGHSMSMLGEDLLHRFGK